ncbi:MAG: hypothetical protein ACXWEY_04405 [Bacteroidia bacterium]
MQTKAQKPFEIRKRRDFGTIIGDTFSYARKHFKPLVKAILIIAGPFILLAAIYTGISQVNVLNYNITDSTFSAVFFNSIISNLIMMLAMVLLIAAIHAYVKKDLENTTGEEIRTDEIWQLVKQNIWKTLGIVLLFFVFFAMIGGLFALIFYAGGRVIFGFSVFLGMFFIIYLAFRLMYVYAAGLLDNYSIIDSFLRSWQMSNGYFWNNFGIMFIFGILVGTVSGFAAIPTAIFTVVGALHGTNAEINPIWKFVVIAIQTVGTFIALICYALPFIAYILQYYSAVEKTEGTGLLQRIENMDLKPEDNQRWSEETY